MSVSQKWIGFGLGAALAIFSGPCAMAQDSSVVAEVGGVKITMAELEQEESAKLLSAHYQYYQAETKALDDLVEKKLIEQKAKTENLTVDQLIERDLKPQVQDPTEDQMKVYYEGLETEQPYAEVREKILEKIRELRMNKARAAYVRSLREKSTVIIALAPPQAKIEVANNAQMLGSTTARVTLVEFADYECPYCQRVAADVNKLKADLGDKLTLTYKDFPLPMHGRAEKAAEAARCAGNQGKFWEFHDELFHSKALDVEQLKAQAKTLKLDSAQFDKCLDSGQEAKAVERDRKEGVKLGITGTPSFFINGHYMSGALEYAALRQLVEQQLAAMPQTASGASK